LKNPPEQSNLNKYLICQESTKRLRELIRLSHPNEHGELFYRSDVIDEFSKRGMSNCFKELGISLDSNLQWINRWTGDKTTTLEYTSEYDLHNNFENHEFIFLLENWDLISEFTGKDLLDSHIIKENIKQSKKGKRK
jgi:hypothetical protein